MKKGSLVRKRDFYTLYRQKDDKRFQIFKASCSESGVILDIEPDAFKRVIPIRILWESGDIVYSYESHLIEVKNAT